ncbi:mechanosensitive ion channel family protein [Geomonas sp. Red32]|uniref:mechanosensitive ion channel family protein n=1 Tax=Geomonas sp. Red32 TaxID=2912856 RepID=UPI00202CE9FB|nr:mechanosensitive ion channel family protein [Geomonas sp. Red32]
MDNILSFFAPDEGDIFFLFWAKQTLISVAVLAVFYLLSRLLRRLLARVGAHYTRLTKHDLVETTLERISSPAALLLNFAGLHLVIKRLPLPERLTAIAAGIVFVINIVIVANIVYRVMDEMLKRYGNKLGPDMSRQLIPLVQKLFSIFLVGTALIITLKHFNYDILSLVTALGVGSLAIGLAAKDTLANMISGFTLMIDMPFRIGDRIQLGNKQGDVVDIGLRSTRIKAVDNTFLIIPNSELCNSTVINMDFPDLRATGSVSLGVTVGSDLDKARKVMEEAALAVSDILKDPAPKALCTGFGDGVVHLSLGFWVSGSRSLAIATDSVVLAVAAAFREHGINIPYPTRTVFMEKDANHAP